MQKQVTITINIDTKDTVNALSGIQKSMRDLTESANNTSKGGAQGSRQWIQSLTDVAAGVGLIKGAFDTLYGVAMKFYDDVIGANLRLQDLVISSATAIAGTNKVFADGIELTDPVERIKILFGDIEDAFENIREQTFALSGVTSQDVLPLFEILSTQISNVGGGIEEAADLAVKFAAGLDVVGVPLSSARQEINSILRGTIDVNSRLGQTLGISNELVNQWKTQGTVVEELNKRLEAFLAGNALKAQTFGGVLSNIQELFQEFPRLLGVPLLDPLIEAGKRFYSVLLQNRELLQEIAGNLGSFLGSIAQTIVEVGTNIARSFGPAVEAVGDLGAAIDQDLVLSIVDDLGIMIQTVAAGFAEATKWAIQLTGTVLPPLLETIKSITSTTIEGFQALVDLAAIVSGGLTGQQVANLDAATALTNEFGSLVETVNSGSALAEGSLEAFRAQLEQLGSQGALTSADIEFYEQTLERLEAQNAAIVASNADVEITFESIQTAANAARIAAEEFKRAQSESRLSQITDELALQQQINEQEITNANQIAAEKLRIERENNERILAAAKERLEVLLMDETLNRDTIIEVKSTIAKQELALAQSVQRERDQLLKQEQEQIQANAKEQNLAIEQQKQLLELQREANSDRIAAFQQESQLLAANAQLREGSLRSEVEAAQLTLQRAQGTEAVVAATQQLQQAQRALEEEQRTNQQAALEREGELIEIKRQGSQLALDLQLAENEARQAGIQAELAQLEARRAAIGELTVLEEAQVNALNQQAAALGQVRDILVENKSQTDQQAAAEQEILGIRQQTLEITAASRDQITDITQLLALQRAEQEALAVSQQARLRLLENEISITQKLSQADSVRAKSLSDQIQVLEMQNQRLGESEARNQQIAQLRREAAKIEADQVEAQARAAVQRERLELARLEVQRESVNLEIQQTEALIQQLRLRGESVEAEQAKLNVLRAQLEAVGSLARAQQGVVSETEKAAASARKLADEMRRTQENAKAAAQSVERSTVALQSSVKGSLGGIQQMADAILGLGGQIDSELIDKLDKAGSKIGDQNNLWSRTARIFGRLGAEANNRTIQLARQVELAKAQVEAYEGMIDVDKQLQGYITQLGLSGRALQPAIDQKRALRDLAQQVADEAERRLQIEQQIIIPLQRQIEVSRGRIEVLGLQNQLIGLQLGNIDRQIEQAREQGKSEEEIAKLVERRTRLIERQQILQARIAELQTKEKILQLELTIATEKQNNADQKRIRNLEEQLNLLQQIAREQAKIQSEIRTSARESRGSSNSEERPISFASGGRFNTGDTIQVGDNPDGSRNATTEIIKMTGPGFVIPRASINPVINQSAPSVTVNSPGISDARIVSGLGEVKNLLKASLMLQGSGGGGGGRRGGNSLRNFVLANA